PGILVGNPSGTAALWLGKDSNDYLEVSWLDPTHGRIFVGGGKPLALQEFGGNVGIGTPSPGYTFHQVGGDHVIEGADISLRRAGMHRWRIQEIARTAIWDRPEANSEIAAMGWRGVVGQPSARRTAGWADGIDTCDL